MKKFSTLSLVRTVESASRFKFPVVDRLLSTRVRLLFADRVAVCAVTLLATTSPFSTWKPEPVSSTCPLLTISPVALPPPPPVSNCGKEGMGNVQFPGGVSAAVSGSTSRLSSCPIRLMRTTFSPGTVATVICPAGAESCPVLATVPPNKIKFPCCTLREPALTIAPG